MATGNGRRKAAESWWPLLRDVGAFVIGSALLLSQTFVGTPNATVVGAGLALIGMTATGRVQEWARGRRDDTET